MPLSFFQDITPLFPDSVIDRAQLSAFFAFTLFEVTFHFHAVRFFFAPPAIFVQLIIISVSAGCWCFQADKPLPLRYRTAAITPSAPPFHFHAADISAPLSPHDYFHIIAADLLRLSRFSKAMPLRCQPSWFRRALSSHIAAIADTATKIAAAGAGLRQPWRCYAILAEIHTSASGCISRCWTAGFSGADWPFLRYWYAAMRYAIRHGFRRQLRQPAAADAGCQLSQVFAASASWWF